MTEVNKYANILFYLSSIDLVDVHSFIVRHRRVVS